MLTFLQPFFEAALSRTFTTGNLKSQQFPVAYCERHFHKCGLKVFVIILSFMIADEAWLLGTEKKRNVIFMNY